MEPQQSEDVGKSKKDTSNEHCTRTGCVNLYLFFAPVFSECTLLRHSSVYEGIIEDSGTGVWAYRFRISHVILPKQNLFHFVLAGEAYLPNKHLFQNDHWPIIHLNFQSSRESCATLRLVLVWPHGPMCTLEGSSVCESRITSF